MLYLIEILHQTTTFCICSRAYFWLYLIEILHQTTTPEVVIILPSGLYLIEILHQTTTLRIRYTTWPSLYLIEILHQTTTSSKAKSSAPGCILSKFYIKPQLRLERELARCVVSYRNSTSNHNPCSCIIPKCEVVSYRNSTSNHNNGCGTASATPLYLIEILHQTTTTWGI